MALGHITSCFSVERDFSTDWEPIWSRWWQAHSATGWLICGTKEKVLVIEFSSNFDDFLQPKPPIFEFLTIFLIKMAKMVIFLGWKLLKNIKISKNIPSL